jgi:DNA-binding NtrC family response regulator
MQAKLLRILQDGAIRPVGEDQEQNVDTRVIAATNRNLENDIGNDIFRSDLFYRLETFTLQIQPLRDREDDIDLLAAHFVARFSTAADKGVRELSSGALECLRDYPFPGNVRELSNAIERAVAFAQGDRIEVHDLPERIRRHDRGIEYTGHHNDAGGLLVGRKLPTLRELEERYVRYVLEQMDGNKSRTASHLGIGRRTLYRYLNSDRS